MEAGRGPDRAMAERRPVPNAEGPGDQRPRGLRSEPKRARTQRQGTGKLPFTAWMPMPIETAS